MIAFCQRECLSIVIFKVRMQKKDFVLRILTVLKKIQVYPYIFAFL